MPIPAAVGAALVTGGANLLGSIGNLFSSNKSNKTNLQMNRETNEMNYKIAQEANAANRANLEYQNQFNLEQWNRENLYNSPMAQVQRLRDAGINPSMAMQGHGVSEASSVTSESASPAAVPTMNPGHVSPLDFSGLSSSLTGAVNSYFDTKLKAEQIKNQQTQNQILTNNADYNDVKNVLEVTKAIKTIEGLDLDNDTKEKALDMLKSQLKVQQATEGAQIERPVKENEKIDSDIQSAREDIERKKEESHRQDVALSIQKALASSQISLNSEQGRKIAKEIDVMHDQNWRSEQMHILDMDAKKLNNSYQRLKNLGLEDEVAFDMVMNAFNVSHEDLKDSSLLNKAAEWLFGFGFRDLGNIIKNMVK